MNFGGGQSHRAADVFNLQPGAVEPFRPLRFRNHTQRSTLHYLRYELVRVKKSSLDRYEEAARSHPTRIMTDVSYDRISIAGQIGLRRRRNVVECYRLIVHGANSTQA